MNIISGKYAVSCTPEGSYYAYSLMHEQCCAYGESEEEALENLETMESEFLEEINVWGIERSGFFNGREKWAKGFENQRV